MANEKRVDAVFEGGGVKGIGLVGAVAATVQRGYQFENVAGTSAGAIVAALVAAGYAPDELKQVMAAVDYEQFEDEGFLDKFGLLGKALSVGFEKGIYEGRFFEEWLRKLLAQKDKRTFGDLVMPAYADDPRYRYRLQVIAADISRGKLLVLPGDIQDYGEKPDDLDIARAVRMSMSIPFFFEPVQLKGNTIVDGGVLSNFPVWLLDDKTTADPPWPTFGYKLVDPQTDRPHEIHGPISLFAALFSTMMEAHDARYLEDRDFARTICIPTTGVRATDFDITRDKADALFNAGFAAAEQFLARWDFDRYKDRYRTTSTPASRTARMWK